MDPFRTHGWRVALVLSGIAMLIGAPRHPESEASDGLRDELATMTADPDWVLAHVFVVASTLLLAVGLAAAYRTRAWPSRTRRALGVAAVVVSLYTVEAVFHLAAAVDSQALQHGDFAPVAFTHILLSVVLYPLTGVAVFALALSSSRPGEGPGSWPRWRAGLRLPALPVDPAHPAAARHRAGPGLRGGGHQRGGVGDRHRPGRGTTRGTDRHHARPGGRLTTVRPLGA